MIFFSLLQLRGGVMRFCVLCIGLCLFLASCSSMPGFELPKDEAGQPTVAQVIDKIECEIAEARDDPLNASKEFVAFLHSRKLKDFGEWSATVTLTLTVNDTAGLYPNTNGLTLTYIDPLKIASQTFGFSGSLVLYQTRTRTFAQQYSINIAKIPPGLSCENSRRWHRFFNLEGNLGIHDQVNLGLHAFDADDPGSAYSTGGGKPDNIQATSSFHIYRGITNLGPTWTIVHFKGPIGGIGYNRDDLHQVVITFVPAALDVPPSKPACRQPKEAPKLPANPDKNAIEKYQLEMAGYLADTANYTVCIASGGSSKPTGGVASAAAANALAAHLNLNNALSVGAAIQNLTRP